MMRYRQTLTDSQTERNIQVGRMGGLAAYVGWFKWPEIAIMGAQNYIKISPPTYHFSTAWCVIPHDQTKNKMMIIKTRRHSFSLLMAENFSCRSHRNFQIIVNVFVPFLNDFLERGIFYRSILIGFFVMDGAFDHFNRNLWQFYQISWGQVI